MAKNWPLVRQEAEALIELLEACPDVYIHDKTALQAATELRELFGMVTLDEERKRKAEFGA